MARRDEDELWGLAHNPDRVDGLPSDSLARRERSTLFGMLRRWPQFDRRLHSREWDGVERRSSRISGPHAV